MMKPQEQNTARYECPDGLGEREAQGTLTIGYRFATSPVAWTGEVAQTYRHPTLQIKNNPK